MRSWPSLIITTASYALLGGCASGGNEDVGGQVPPGPTSRPLLFTAQNVGQLLFDVYLAHSLRVRLEPLERNPRQYVEGTHPSCRSGSLQVQFDDKDGDGELSTGDEVRVFYDHCIYDSVRGYGEVFMDGGLSFTSIDVTLERDRWYATRYTQTQYQDAWTDGHAEFALAYSAEVAWTGIPGVASSVRMVNGMILDCRLDGKEVFISGGNPGLGAISEHVLDVGGDGYEQRFEEHFQVWEVIQRADVWVAILGFDNGLGIAFRAMTPAPLRGRASQNDGYPSEGSLRIHGVYETHPGYFPNATATLTANGADGQVTITAFVDDALVVGDEAVVYSAQTTWQALAAQSSLSF